MKKIYDVEFLTNHDEYFPEKFPLVAIPTGYKVHNRTWITPELFRDQNGMIWEERVNVFKSFEFGFNTYRAWSCV
jgi:hypothetical protein